MTKTKKERIFDFDFWQRFGKTLMVVIAVMPAAGLMISIGKVIAMSVETGMFHTLAATIENIGWAIITNLHLLFAVAIGGSWAYDRAGGAFAAALAFILINRITGSLFGIDAAMLADDAAKTRMFFGLGKEIAVSGYFTSVLEAPALNMGVFSGMISGFLGANIYNKYHDFDGLPESLSFFNGKRFVPFVVIAQSFVLAVLLGIFWPIVQTGINRFGMWIATSQDSAPFFAPFIFGTMERLLIPFGLHHMLTIPINYTAMGGQYEILTGAQAGAVVFGQDPLWLAWVSDLANLKTSGDMQTYQMLLDTIHPARFKVGQMIGSTGILMGLTYAMYQHVDKKHIDAYKPMYFSAAIAVFLTGVTEPIEFMFMFTAPLLYFAYAIVQGLAFAMADLLPLRVHSFGFIELLTRVPLIVKAGITKDFIYFLLVSLFFAVMMYLIARFLIEKKQLATPGRFVEEDKVFEKMDIRDHIEEVIEGLGGKENIVHVDACMTRLRVKVKDEGQVWTENSWKQIGAVGLVQKNTSIQVIIGPNADFVKNEVSRRL